MTLLWGVNRAVAMQPAESGRAVVTDEGFASDGLFPGTRCWGPPPGPLGTTCPPAGNRRWISFVRPFSDPLAEDAFASSWPGLHCALRGTLVPHCRQAARDGAPHIKEVAPSSATSCLSPGGFSPHWVREGGARRPAKGSVAGSVFGVLRDPFPSWGAIGWLARPVIGRAAPGTPGAGASRACLPPGGFAPGRVDSSSGKGDRRAKLRRSRTRCSSCISTSSGLTEGGAGGKAVARAYLSEGTPSLRDVAKVTRVWRARARGGGRNQAPDPEGCPPEAKGFMPQAGSGRGVGIGTL